MWLSSYLHCLSHFRYRCIEGLTAFAQPILDLICQHTGMVGSMFLMGPEPADGGRINVIGYEDFFPFTMHSSHCFQYPFWCDIGRRQDELWRVGEA